MARSSFVGVDGCKGGWFSVGLDRDGFEAKVFCTFRELLDYYASAKLILVDIPIGLPEGKGGRDCDRKARKLLGRPRASSVFPTPTRQTVQQASRAPKDHRAAVRIEKEVAGKGIGIQTFNIAPKIAEVDEVMRTRGLGCGAAGARSPSRAPLLFAELWEAHGIPEEGKPRERRTALRTPRDRAEGPEDIRGSVLQVPQESRCQRRHT